MRLKGKPMNDSHDAHSFCESVTASSISPWCVRRLTPIGRKLSGGIDTDSLCGRVKAPHGWDLESRVVLSHPSMCPRCKAELERQADAN